MLTMSAEAAQQIRSIVSDSANSGAIGLRIADDTSGRLALTLAEVPAEDDQVVEADGARVFLDPAAARVLEEQTLDVGTDQDGRLQFSLAQQA